MPVFGQSVGGPRSSSNLLTNAPRDAAGVGGPAPFIVAGPTHGVALGVTQFYTDAADASMTALAAENAALAVTGAQVQNGIVRLRFQLQETSAVAGSGAVTLEYDGGSGTYTAVETQVVTSNKQGVWLRWANGTATDGATLSTNKLTGTTTSGPYLESPGQVVSVGASQVVEVDAALLIHWPPPDTNITLRVLYGGVSVGTVTLTTPTAADRPNTVVRLDGDAAQKTSREVRFGPWQRVFWEPNEGAWWLFTVQYGTPTILRSYKRVGTGNWSAGATFTFSSNGFQSLHAVTWRVVAGVPTVYALYGSSSTSRYLNRGTIATGTLTWGTEQTLTQASDRHRYVTVDDGGYVWIAGTTAATGLWVRRATAVDSVTGFDAATAVADTAVASGDVISLVGLASNKVLVLWRPTGTNVPIKYAIVTSAGVSSSGSVSTTTTTGPEDWGVTRSGGYVYLIHSDAAGSGGNWVMRVMDETPETWATATSPVVSGQPSSNDGIPLSASGNDIYAFGTFSGTEGGQDRIIQYKKYTGPGAAGTWGALTTLGSAGGRVNSDHLSVPRNAANNTIVVLSAANDDDVNGNARTIEYFTLVTSTLTQVTATRATTWRVTAHATSTRATTHRVLAHVTAARSTTFDVLTPVTSTRATTHRVLAPVTATRATTWVVRAPVTATRATTFRVLTTATSARATSWDTLSQLTAARATTHRVLAPVTSTRATTFRVLTQPVSARATTWRVTARATSTRATTWDVAASGLAAPTGLTATAVSQTQINLAWNAVTNATGYDIERNSVIIVTNQPGLTYSDTGLGVGTTHSYRVRARQAA